MTTIVTPPKYLRSAVRSGPVGAAGDLGVYLHRPYLDLSVTVEGPRHALGIASVFDHLAEPTAPVCVFQTHPSRRLRTDVVRASGLDEYAAPTPAALPEHLRTPRWRRLVEMVEGYADLDTEQQSRLLGVLGRLCYYPVILSLQGPVSERALRSDPASGRIAIKRANALQKLRPGEHLVEFARIADLAGDRRVRLSAALSLVVQYSKHTYRDLDQVQRWADRALSDVDILDPESSFLDSIFASTLWRAVSLAAFHRGDRAQTVAQLDLAEAHARRFTPATPLEETLWGENLHPVLETRVKEALWLGDHELAEQRCRALVAHDRFDAKVHIQLGNLLSSRGRVEQARDAYAAAQRLGVPFAAVAAFYVGHCQELMGEYALAMDTYLEAYLRDPACVSSVMALGRLARRLGQLRLADWALTELNALRGPR